MNLLKSSNMFSSSQDNVFRQLNQRAMEMKMSYKDYRRDLMGIYSKLPCKLKSKIFRAVLKMGFLSVLSLSSDNG